MDVCRIVSAREAQATSGVEDVQSTPKVSRISETYSAVSLAKISGRFQVVLRVTALLLPVLSLCFKLKRYCITHLSLKFNKRLSEFKLSQGIRELRAPPLLLIYPGQHCRCLDRVGIIHRETQV